ncbi:putative epoxide hydrolase domain-containing protein [Diplogelasinospora grovesii]|uniref:Epoxide hydrolase domain-containing protein n=1 Tax=Diplogelasinospora grovesii TaxID=303347 RepID=A0AAN6NI27_9PEZI|nr:putative epoxide hydrolase domain-containing protein [Diplogelasinospora grovesii]
MSTKEDVHPFKIAIPDAELHRLRQKLEGVRLPHRGVQDDATAWGESASNGVSVGFIQKTVDFWLSDEYDWRAEERKINEMLPQFKTTIEIEDTEFGALDVHFVHAPSTNASSAAAEPIPLLFLHGWPGSFLEVAKVLPHLTAAGITVVCPSLPGFGFSSYPNKTAGFKFFHHADVVHRLMTEKLGYAKYAVQGGDWGSIVARSLALRYPDSVAAVHTNALVIPSPPNFPPDSPPVYTPQELNRLGLMQHFFQSESAYQAIHATKPVTFGVGLHDSPVAMLAWVADKLLTWADTDKEGKGGGFNWTPADLITWTLVHWFSNEGPTTALAMYRENMPPLMVLPPEILREGGNYVSQPYGISAFAKEHSLVPRAWAEKENNVVFWAEHERGGHFAAWECPDELSADIVAFLREHWKAA